MSALKKAALVVVCMTTLSALAGTVSGKLLALLFTKSDDYVIDYDKKVVTSLTPRGDVFLKTQLGFTTLPFKWTYVLSENM